MGPVYTVDGLSPASVKGLATYLQNQTRQYNSWTRVKYDKHGTPYIGLQNSDVAKKSKRRKAGIVVFYNTTPDIIRRCVEIIATYKGDKQEQNT